MIAGLPKIKMIAHYFFILADFSFKGLDISIAKYSETS
jgi:hypothetical protein